MMKKKLEKIRVDCTDLAIGMYVCELDRPWLESPFMVQGFYLKDPDDIATVRGVCDYVFVDKFVERQNFTRNANLPSATSSIMPRGIRAAGSAARRKGMRLSRDAGDGMLTHRPQKEQGIDEFFPGKNLVQYSDTVNWRDEAGSAKRAVSYLYDYIVQFMNLSQKADRLDLQHVSKAVGPMVNSVIRNPDACLWWTTMKPAGQYGHDSALRTSVYAVVIGRRLGLPEEDLLSLATGGLLFDVGRSRLENTILRGDRRFTPEEIALMQRHVDIGLNLLERSGLDDAQVIDYVAHHHERFDGSGYPQRLSGNRIPAFGRIAGLVDCYNAMTSSRVYAAIRSPAEAINQLYKLKGVHFHTDLIEEFIQAIGVYPVGALVELSSGEVAIVVAQSRTRRLRPIVLQLLDGDKKPPAKPRYIELDNTFQMDDGRKYDIVKNLEPNAHGIDMAGIRLI